MLFSVAVMFFCLSTIIGYSQQITPKEETKTLFKDQDKPGLKLSTFYGEIAPRTAFATIHNSTGPVFLMELGIHINRKFALGYYSARSPNTNVINVPASSDPNYQDWINSGVELDQLPAGQTQAYAYFFHSGINLAYMHKADKIVFLRGGIKAGRGTLEMLTEQKQTFNFFKTSIYKNKVWGLNPEIGVGVNLRSWWRLHADVGYHFIFEGSSEIISKGQFDGTTFRIGFAFGAFNR